MENVFYFLIGALFGACVLWFSVKSKVKAKSEPVVSIKGGGGPGSTDD